MSTYIPIILLWIIIFITLRNEKNENIRRIIKRKKKRDDIKMNEVFNRYVGKDCIVYISNSSTSVLECNVISVNDNWLLVKTKDGEEVINIDYIVKIKEHPVNKNGKKKSIIFYLNDCFIEFFSMKQSFFIHLCRFLSSTNCASA